MAAVEYLRPPAAMPTLPVAIAVMITCTPSVAKTLVGGYSEQAASARRSFVDHTAGRALDDEVEAGSNTETTRFGSALTADRPASILPLP